MTNQAPEDLEFCLEKARQWDTWFRLHISFAPKARVEQLAALYSLFALLERPLRAGDETVALAQLAWWHEEFSTRQLFSSRHPAIRLLRNNIEAEVFADMPLQDLVTQAFRILQFQSITGKPDFKSVCNEIGELRTHLELSVVGECEGIESVAGHCSATGLASLVSLALSSPGLWSRFVPLDLLAAHQVGCKDIEDGNAAAHSAIDELRDWGDSWFDDQWCALMNARRPSKISVESAVHIGAVIQCEKLKFLRMMEQVKKGRAAMDPISWGAGDAVKIWWRCRTVANAWRGSA